MIKITVHSKIGDFYRYIPIGASALLQNNVYIFKKHVEEIDKDGIKHTEFVGSGFLDKDFNPIRINGTDTPMNEIESFFGVTYLSRVFFGWKNKRRYMITPTGFIFRVNINGVKMITENFVISLESIQPATRYIFNKLQKIY